MVKNSINITAFDYFDQTLTVLSAASGEISIISFASVIRVPVEIPSATFSLIFSLTTGITKKLLKATRNKKKRHNKIFMLAKSKLNNIQTLIFQALIDLEISYEEFKTIVNEKEKHEKMKENIRMMKSDDKQDELSKNDKNIRKTSGNAWN